MFFTKLIWYNYFGVIFIQGSKDFFIFISFINIMLIRLFMYYLRFIHNYNTFLTLQIIKRNEVQK